MPRCLALVSRWTAGRYRVLAVRCRGDAGYRTTLPDGDLDAVPQTDDDALADAVASTARRLLFEQVAFDDGSDAAHVLLQSIEYGGVLTYAAGDRQPETHVLHIHLDDERVADTLPLLTGVDWVDVAPDKIARMRHGRYVAHGLEFAANAAALADGTAAPWHRGGVTCAVVAVIMVCVGLLVADGAWATTDVEAMVPPLVHEVNREL